jgi:signal transduction histidine kinase
MRKKIVLTEKIIKIIKILKRSITRKMLVVVFSIYLVLTIAVTLAQMNFEYETTKRQTVEALSDIAAMTDDSLSQAIWEFNVAQIKSILQGISTNKIIVGQELIVFDSAALEELKNLKLGLINNENEEIVTIDAETLKATVYPSRLLRLLPYKHEIYHTDLTNHKQKIGEIILYSSNKIVFDQVKENFIILIINACIKTIALWVCFLWAGYTYISKPLAQLNTAIKQLATGNWNAELVSKVIKENKKTEINTLIDSFNEMTHELHAAQINLQKHESALAQSEKLASVGALMAGIAHEINNPLGSIMQSTQNVLRRIDPELEVNQQAATVIGIDLHKQHEYLQKREILTFLDNIRVAGERASSIVKNMLRFTRRSNSEMSRSNVVDLINDGLQLVLTDFSLQENADLKQIVIEKNFCANEVFIDCFPIEIQQVILNLLKNAIQALQTVNHSKKITIELEKLDESHIRLIIADNGPGMPDDVKSQIFKPFFTTKPVGIGTGLGLSVCRNIIVEKHRGTMEVESAVGAGTKFIIDLPIIKS